PTRRFVELASHRTPTLYGVAFGPAVCLPTRAHRAILTEQGIMAKLEIRIYGDPVLREKARPMEREEVGESFASTIQDMAETMYAASGIGLAATQVGDTRRFFVCDV